MYVCVLGSLVSFIVSFVFQTLDSQNFIILFILCLFFAIVSLFLFVQSNLEGLEFQSSYLFISSDIKNWKSSDERKDRKCILLRHYLLSHCWPVGSRT